MSAGGDDCGVPTPQLSDRTVDDLVAGRPVSGEADLVAAIGVLAASARVAPPPPSTALAALLVDGGAPALTGVLSARRPARWAPGRRWATGGAVGIGAALLTLTGAAAAQALPSPLQAAVSGAVRALTPFELPGGRDQTPDRDIDPAPVAPGGVEMEQDVEEGRSDGLVTDGPDGGERTDEPDVRDDGEGRGADGGEDRDAAEDLGGDEGGDDAASADTPAGDDASEVGDSDIDRDTTGSGPYSEDSRGGGTDQDAPDQDAPDQDAPEDGGAAGPAEQGEPTGTDGLGGDGPVVSDPVADDPGAGAGET